MVVTITRIRGQSGLVFDKTRGGNEAPPLFKKFVSSILPPSIVPRHNFKKQEKWFFEKQIVQPLFSKAGKKKSARPPPIPNLISFLLLVPQTKTFHCEIVNTQSQFPPRFIVGAQSRNDLGSIRRAAGRVGRERRKRNLARLSKEERKKQNEAYSILLGH